MRRIALSISFVLAATTAATAAGPNWHVAGWYIAKNVPIKQAITIYGDYKTRDDCETARNTPATPATPATADAPAIPAKPDFMDHGSVTFECIYLDREPMH